MIRAKNPFVFQTRLDLLEITGRKAKNLKELVDLIESASPSVIYHHTQHFLSFQQYMSPKSPNDFAHWIKKELHEDALSEKIIALDLQKLLDVHELKEKVLQLTKEHLASDEYRPFDVPSGKEFHFINAKTFIMPTGQVVCNLLEFCEALKKVSVNSIYFHLFGVGALLGKREDSFSYWLENELKEVNLANCISRLDPFVFHTAEDLKSRLIKLVKKRLETIKKSEEAII